MWVQNTDADAGARTELPASALSNNLRTQLKTECEDTERAYLKQLAAARQVADHLQPLHEHLSAEYKLAVPVDAADRWLSGISGFDPDTFQIFVLRRASDVTAVDQTGLFDADELAAVGGISFAVFGFGLVFTEQITRDIDTATDWQVLHTAVHELAHLHALKLLRIAFATNDAGDVAPKTLRTTGFTLSRNGGGHNRYEHINEYWAEMAALQALSRTQHLALDLGTVAGRYIEGLEVQGPRYAADITAEGNVTFNETGIIAAAIGEADRAADWPVWRALYQDLVTGEPFNPRGVDAAIKAVAGDEAAEVLDMTMSTAAGAARVSEILSRHRGLSTPVPFISRYHDSAAE